MLSKYEIHLYDNNVLTYTTDYQCKTDKGALNYATRWARSKCSGPLNMRYDKWQRSHLGLGYVRDFSSCYVGVFWETSTTKKGEVAENDGRNEVGER